MSKDYGNKDRDNFLNELRAARYKSIDKRELLNKILKREFPWFLEQKAKEVSV